MKIISSSEKWLSEDTRLLKRLYHAESGEQSSGSFIFAFQYLWFRKDRWLEIARIDNYVHEAKRRGVHIHKFGSNFVEFREMSLTEASGCIMLIGEDIKKRILLGDYCEEN